MPLASLSPPGGGVEVAEPAGPGAHLGGYLAPVGVVPVLMDPHRREGALVGEKPGGQVADRDPQDQGPHDVPDHPELAVEGHQDHQAHHGPHRRQHDLAVGRSPGGQPHDPDEAVQVA